MLLKIGIVGLLMATMHSGCLDSCDSEFRDATWIQSVEGLNANNDVSFVTMNGILGSMRYGEDPGTILASVYVEDHASEEDVRWFSIGYFEWKQLGTPTFDGIQYGPSECRNDF